MSAYRKWRQVSISVCDLSKPVKVLGLFALPAWSRCSEFDDNKMSCMCDVSRINPQKKVMKLEASSEQNKTNKIDGSFAQIINLRNDGLS